jgi:hypothetical protein
MLVRDNKLFQEAQLTCTYLCSAIFLVMAVLKLRESLADVHGQVSCNAFKDLSLLSPLLAVFVRDGSFAFLL